MGKKKINSTTKHEEFRNLQENPHEQNRNMQNQNLLSMNVALKASWIILIFIYTISEAFFK